MFKQHVRIKKKKRKRKYYIVQKKLLVFIKTLLVYVVKLNTSQWKDI